jgi:hypothetical protein
VFETAALICTYGFFTLNPDAYSDSSYNQETRSASRTSSYINSLYETRASANLACVGLLALLTARIEFGATDPQDRIYAVLGLVTKLKM